MVKLVVEEPETTALRSYLSAHDEESRVTSALALTEGGRIPALSLRSLDAIHVATAEYAELAVSAFVTYDKRLAEIAASRGLLVVAPA